MTQRIALDQIIEAAPARVVVTEDASGQVTGAEFDLTGLPRVDAALVGRPVMEVPPLVERLCSICPTAHHLAGMRALESLAGLGQLPPTAEKVRRLLHHAGVIGIHVMGLISTDPDEALILRRFSKAAMAAVGSPGHFPVTAVPGGVRAPADPDLVQACTGLAGEALDAALRVAGKALDTHVPLDHFTGADLALIDSNGQLDLFGQDLRAVAADGTLIIAEAPTDDWDSLIAEADPGSANPRPYLTPLGPGSGKYRVGPVSQLRVGPVSTPIAADLQQSWMSHHGGAHAARAIITVHCVEVIASLLADPDLCHSDGHTPAAWWPSHLPAGAGVGWVDGARGLLVHRYAIDDDALVTSATILTPTAQNEPWLSDLLRTAAQATDEKDVRASMEDAIREADPCLPCSSAAPGTMDLEIDIEKGA